MIQSNRFADSSSTWSPHLWLSDEFMILRISLRLSECPGPRVSCELKQFRVIMFFRMENNLFKLSEISDQIEETTKPRLI